MADLLKKGEAERGLELFYMLTDSGLAYSDRGRRTPGRAGPQQLTENLQLSEFQTISPVNSSLPDFLKVPKEHRVKLHSTNPIERLNGEIKRRTSRQSALATISAAA